MIGLGLGLPPCQYLPCQFISAVFAWLPPLAAARSGGGESGSGGSCGGGTSTALPSERPSSLVRGRGRGRGRGRVRVRVRVRDRRDSATSPSAATEVLCSPG